MKVLKRVTQRGSKKWEERMQEDRRMGEEGGEAQEKCVNFCPKWRVSTTSIATIYTISEISSINSHRQTPFVAQPTYIIPQHIIRWKHKLWFSCNILREFYRWCPWSMLQCRTLRIPYVLHRFSSWSYPEMEPVKPQLWQWLLRNLHNFLRMQMCVL